MLIRQTLIIAITAHWIDKHWNLHEALLDFKRLHGSHKGRKLAKSIFDTLMEFNIAEKLFCITTDNASNNQKAMKHLTMLLKKKKIRWKWEEHHISCLNHVIDLAVQAFLKSIKFIEDSETEQEEEEGDEDNDEEENIAEGYGDEGIEEEVRDEARDEEREEDEEEEEEEEDPSLPQQIADSANEFQTVLWKLREIVKVCPLLLRIFLISKLILPSRKQNLVHNEGKYFTISA